MEEDGGKVKKKKKSMISFRLDAERKERKEREPKWWERVSPKNRKILFSRPVSFRRAIVGGVTKLYTWR